MQALQTDDDLSQYFGGLLEGEHLLFKFSLVVDEVSTVAVLQHQVDEVVVFLDVVEADDVVGFHGAHALDLAV